MLIGQLTRRRCGELFRDQRLPSIDRARDARYLMVGLVGWSHKAGICVKAALNGARLGTWGAGLDHLSVLMGRRLIVHAGVNRHGNVGLRRLEGSIDILVGEVAHLRL